MFSALKPHNYSGFDQENVQLVEHNCVLGPAQVNSSGKRRGWKEGWAGEEKGRGLVGKKQV